MTEQGHPQTGPERTKENKITMERKISSGGTRSIKVQAALRVVALAVVILLAYLIIEVLLPSNIRIHVPAFALPAIIACSALLTIATIVRCVFVGPFANSLTNAMLVLTAFMFVFIFLFVRPYYLSDRSGLAFPVLMIGSLIAAGAFLRAMENQYHWLLIRAALLVSIGAILFLFSGSLGLSGPAVFGPVIAISLITVAGISSIALLHQNNNLYLRLIGRFFRNNVVIVTAAILALVIAIYSAEIRPNILRSNPDLVVLSEWVLIGLLALIFTLAFFFHLRKKGAKPEFGSWRKHIQVIHKSKGELEHAAGVVDGFIKNGRKDEVVVMMTAILLNNHQPQGTVCEVVKDIVDYQTKKVPSGFRWTVGDIGSGERKEREMLVDQMMAKAAGFLNTDHPSYQVQMTDGPLLSEERA